MQLPGFTEFDAGIFNSTNDAGATLPINVDWVANTITEGAGTKSIRDVNEIRIYMMSIALVVGTLLKAQVVVNKDPGGANTEIYRLAGHENALPGGVIQLLQPLILLRGSGLATDAYRLTPTFSTVTGAIARHFRVYGFWK